MCALTPVFFSLSCRLHVALSRDYECAFSADECQVQWMAINPVEDDPDCDWHDGDEGGGDIDEVQQMLASDALRSSSGCFAESDELLAERSTRSLTEPEVDLQSDQEDDPVNDAPKPAAGAADSDSSPKESTYPLHECAPLLELSISEEELDLLISSLPASSPEDDSSDPSVDPKHAATVSTASSEMQWVLSFLTDPDAAAHHDAEAKCLMVNAAKHEDDNYQYFLQELDQANLLFCAADADDKVTFAQDGARRLEKSAGGRELSAVGLATLDTSAAQDGSELNRDKQDSVPSCLLSDTDPVSGDDVDDDSDDDGASDDDWDTVRRSMKSQASRRSATSSTRAESSRIRTGDMASPPPPAPVSCARPFARGPSSGLAALSEEIGDLLKTHGEFHFPKRLFPHHNDALEK